LPEPPANRIADALGGPSGSVTMNETVTPARVGMVSIDSAVAVDADTAIIRTPRDTIEEYFMAVLVRVGVDIRPTEKYVCGMWSRSITFA
jgi:hypothetical protein